METAKKIQAGEIDGKIICNNAVAEILAFDVYFAQKRYIVAKTNNNSGTYGLRLYTQLGKDLESDIFHELKLEVPDIKPQFKEYDRVLVRDFDYKEWKCALFSFREGNEYYASPIVVSRWNQCIPYKGNEQLVGTTDKPKED